MTKEIKYKIQDRQRALLEKGAEYKAFGNKECLEIIRKELLFLDDLLYILNDIDCSVESVEDNPLQEQLSFEDCISHT